MATIVVSNTGGDYNNPLTWIGGVVPTALDNVEFTNTSGNLDITPGSECASINLTNCVSIINFLNELNVFGNIDLGTGGYTQSGPFGFALFGNCTLQSNLVVWTRTLSFINALTITLLNIWFQNGEIFTIDGLTIDLRGYSFNINGLLTQNVLEIGETSTSIINLNGTINLTNLSFCGTELNYLGGVANINELYLYKSVSGNTITLNTGILNLPKISVGGTTLNLYFNSIVLTDKINITSGTDITFTGNYGFNAKDLFINYFGTKIFRLKAGVTYLVQNNCSIENATFLSTTPGTKANFYLRPGCNQLVANLNATDINASGQGINNFYGVTNNCQNIAILIENTI